QVAAKSWRHIANFGAEAATGLHRKLAVLDVSADGARAANVNQIPHSDVALQYAVYLGVLSPRLTVQPAALVDVHRVGRHLAMDAAEDFDPAAIADLASHERIFTDNEYAFVRNHFSAPRQCRIGLVRNFGISETKPAR